MDEDDGLIRVDIDKKLLRKAKKLCAKQGYTIEEVITIFLEEIVKADGFPTEIQGK